MMIKILESKEDVSDKYGFAGSVEDALYRDAKWSGSSDEELKITSEACIRD
jgi:hypothetical protein